MRTLLAVPALAACLAALMAALAGCNVETSATAPAASPDDFSALVSDPRTATDLKADIASGALSAEAATRAFLDRIKTVDDDGPKLNAVLLVNPDAIAIAAALDQAKADGKPLGPLHGVAILVKDNIDTLDMPTTAGSLALKDNITGRDAPIIARLRAAGAVILGKTNLSEWANFRSNYSSSGWSGAGGQTKNPHALDRNPCGSSSGAGAAMAAGLAAAAIGTETNGSIVCPAGANGIVGLKPTVGLLPRTYIVPISASQDTAGPMTLSVADAALLLTVMAGSDPSDPATKDADARKEDYTKALDPNALRGKRIGVARFLAGYSEGADKAFNAALETLKSAGAELVEITDSPDRSAMNAAQGVVLNAEFKAGVAAYLATTAPDKVKPRTLDDLIAFNRETAAELQFFGQDTFEEAAKAPALTDKAYLDARAAAKNLAGPQGIDKLLADNKVEALVAPTGGPAWVTDLVNGDNFAGASSGYAAIAGYPNISVPMGDVQGLPVGLSIFGAAWSEAKLIGFAYAFEQASKARMNPKFPAHIP